MEQEEQNNIFVPLVSGASASLTVTLSLFPLDTITTRLQSEGGIWKSGGFRNIYAGLAPEILGSAPSAALFFVTYDFIKTSANKLHQIGINVSENDPRLHSLAAATGVFTSCLVYVPVEIIKQRRQANSTKYNSSYAVIKQIWKHERFKGFYRGYTTTVLRDVPLCVIEFCIWERLKFEWKQRQNQDAEAWQSAVCGSVASGIGALIGTPLDVAKTRIMLAKTGSDMAKKESLTFALSSIYKQNGIRGLFAGVIPSTLSMSIGGFLFFGVYEKTKILMTSWITENK